MWFEDLVGFPETDGSSVRSKLTHDGEFLTSDVNGRLIRCGTLRIPSLADLRIEASAAGFGEETRTSTRTRVSELVADVSELHLDPDNAGAVFQVASQFNLLEMASPAAVPEEGVGIYQFDRTQGPACAVACGGGTIQRNWFAPVVVAGREEPQIGQSTANQVDCLSDLGSRLDNAESRLWSMQNGYCFASSTGLDEITSILGDPAERESLLRTLRVGVQQDVEVTLSGAGHLVSQVYCSAMPVGYSTETAEDWKPFATLALDAAYESTLLAAMVNAKRTGNNRLFLTLLGGGVFGNPRPWILASIRRALLLFPVSGLDVVIVSYGRSQPDVALLAQAWETT